MPHLEPTYLRYIYDGLIKGSIHPENAAELPEGLIGLYEEAFDERTSVMDRQQLLERFAIWALLKKEVSAAFVAEVLGESEDDIQEFISTYSSWFNSPESGKYQLYHERLKVYLLQKLSEGEVHVLHEKLISRLEQAIEEQKADEFEWYGLEFLAIHVSLSAIILGDGQKLLNLAYSQSHWQRQLKISKSYTWTKNSLSSVMLWASKYNDEEVIECGLQMLDLHHQEQNAAPQIVALVAEGDFDAALKRIEQFGGNDKEGLQRKFILYMLCLMELTLLKRKDKPFRKEGIEKLLKHLDEQLPVDHSILNWNDFFSSYLIFQMACDWEELGLDYLIVYKRTNNWESDWLKEKGICTKIEFEVLLQCVKCISSDFEKSRVLSYISTELAKQGKTEEAEITMREAIACIRGINDEEKKSIVLVDISSQLAKQGNIEEALDYARMISNNKKKIRAISNLSSQLAKNDHDVEAKYLMEEAHFCANSMCNVLDKIVALLDISAQLALQDHEVEAKSLIEEAIKCAQVISDESDRSRALREISTELAKQGNIEDALACTKGISKDYWKSTAFKEISIQLAKQGKLNEAIDYAMGINDNQEKYIAIMEISIETSKQGKFEQSFEWVQRINNNRTKCYALIGISNELVEIEEAENILQKALVCSRGNMYIEYKTEALKDIAIQFANRNKIDDAKSTLKEALLNNRFLGDESARNRILLEILNEFSLNLNFELVELVIYEVLNIPKGLSDDKTKFETLELISVNLASSGKIKEALICANGMKTSEKGVANDEWYKNKTIAEISIEISKQGNIVEAIECAKSIDNEDIRNYSIQKISNLFASQGKFNIAADCLSEIVGGLLSNPVDIKNSSLNFISIQMAIKGNIEEALKNTELINNDKDKSETLKEISKVLVKQGNHEDALNITSDIINESEKSNALKEISEILTNQGKIEEAFEVLKEITEKKVKSSALKEISGILAKQGEVDLALEVLQKITDEIDKSTALKEISITLSKLGKIDEALEICRGINTENAKYYALMKISNVLEEKKNIEKAAFVFEESLECVRLITYSYVGSGEQKIKAYIELVLNLANGDKNKEAITILHEALAFALEINDNREKKHVLQLLINELIKHDYLILAEKIIIQIPHIFQRQICWNSMTKSLFNELGLQRLFKSVNKFHYDEGKTYYLKELSNLIGVIDSSKGLISDIIVYYLNDFESLKKIMQNYALHELFLARTSEDNIFRLNQTFDFQWAINIKNQLPN